MMKLNGKLVTESYLENPQIFKNYTLLNNSWVKDEIKSEIRKYFELTANKDTTEEGAVNTKVLREKHAGNRPV